MVAQAAKTVKQSISEATKAQQDIEKAAKFKALVQKRTSNAIKSMRLVGNMASPNYIYSVDQVDKVISALQAEVDTVHEAFKVKKGKEKISFLL